MVRPGGRQYVLAIDHRASLRKWASACVGAEVPASVLSGLKSIVAEALVAAVDWPAEGALGEREHEHEQGSGPVAASEVALLVEPEYGSAAIARCRAAGLRVVVPAERSGMPEFIFEHGDDFGQAILDSGADVVKALVRYNPASDPDGLARSRRRLARLWQWCESAGYPLMLEVLVPPSDPDFEPGGEVNPEFDTARRPELTVAAIAALRTAGIEAQWWKLEGQPDLASFTDIAEATGAAAGETSCLVLGRGAGDAQLAAWVEMAAETAGFDGFAIGRSLWAAPLEKVLLGRLEAEVASRQISSAYLALIELYRGAEQRPAAGGEVS